ncbi:MAG: mechanosensitive ion channel, partial [Bacteroidales bacterium]|nr:mechanosensitive ion channel [Bacteroidales bacterium]
IYILGAWIVKLVRKILKRGFERKKTEATVAGFVISLVTILLWIIIIVLTISTLGINTSSLAALLAAGGVAIGMSLSGTVQNFAGGIMLLIFKPFKAGDFIEALGYTGIVKEVNIVSTKLATTDNRLIILPNGALSSGNINNISTNPLRRVDITVSVKYGSDVEQVKAALLDIASDDARVLLSTTKGASDPFVGLIALKESSVDFVLRAWVETADYWPVFFALNEAIYSQLPKKYGISFPFPQLDVHIQN